MNFRMYALHVGRDNVYEEEIIQLIAEDEHACGSQLLPGVSVRICKCVRACVRACVHACVRVYLPSRVLPRDVRLKMHLLGAGRGVGVLRCLLL